MPASREPVVASLSGYLEHFRLRVLQDAVAQATKSYWLRRAAAFTAVGNERCDRIAEACRNAAEVALVQDVDSQIVGASQAERDCSWLVSEGGRL